VIVSTEAGQGGLDILSEIPAITGAIESLFVEALTSDEVQAEITATARPLMLEAAAYIVAGMALTYVLLGRR